MHHPVRTLESKRMYCIANRGFSIVVASICKDPRDETRRLLCLDADVSDVCRLEQPLGSWLEWVFISEDRRLSLSLWVLLVKSRPQMELLYAMPYCATGQDTIRKIKDKNSSVQLPRYTYWLFLMNDILFFATKIQLWIFPQILLSSLLTSRYTCEKV
jgi:hypothetical protein